MLNSVSSGEITQFVCRSLFKSPANSACIGGAAVIEKICWRDRELAVILRASYHAEGIRFFTPCDFSQQLGYMCRPQGYVIPPHVHNPVPREVHYTKEVLFLRRGRV